ncbi:MAG: crossover junction endodeoxyribonuclease RuvC [Methanoregulaceae archaeon]|jgi:crossover junction endodeoxyribonuclease RuvC|nr:crossover junction endodeoxyribonuclease RuvC [Methanoregulaceae archaeon]
MITIGIDPGIATIGYGVLEEKNRKICPLCYSAIITSGKVKGIPERLEEIYVAICKVLDLYHPDCMAIEKLFFARNVTSALNVAEVRGVIMLAARQRRIPVAEYTPNQVKQAVTGSGKADKRQMQEMIRRLLSLEEIPRPDDVADALSVALCHMHTAGIS